MNDETDPRAELLAKLQSQVDHEEAQRMDDNFLKAARAVLELWAQWWQADNPVAVPVELDLKFRMVYPLATHALNTVAVALELLPTLPWVAAANARIAFEHALTSQWIVLTYNGEQEFRLWMENEAHKRAKEFYNGLTNPPPEYAAIVGEEPLKSDWNVWSACARFTDSPKLFYDIYRNLSGATHPSFGTTTAYLDTTSDAKIKSLNRQGSAAKSDGETPRALGASALWALDALEELREGRPHVTEVVSVGSEAGIPTSLRDSDQHPERQRPQP